MRDPAPLWFHAARPHLGSNRRSGRSETAEGPRLDDPQDLWVAHCFPSLEPSSLLPFQYLLLVFLFVMFFTYFNKYLVDVFLKPGAER